MALSSQLRKWSVPQKGSSVVDASSILEKRLNGRLECFCCAPVEGGGCG